MKSGIQRRRWLAAVGASLIGGGCVERTLTIDSNPPRALVSLNDQEIGRTPVSREFTWYGTYDVELREEGYEPLKTQGKVWAPWWQWVPFDLVAELMPVRLEDHHRLDFALQPPTTRQANPDELVLRGERLRSRMESSERTKKPTTHPATRTAAQASRGQASTAATAATTRPAAE